MKVAQAVVVDDIAEQDAAVATASTAWATIDKLHNADIAADRTVFSV